MNTAGTFDIQMDQLHVVGQMTGDKTGQTVVSSVQSPKEETDQGFQKNNSMDPNS